MSSKKYTRLTLKERHLIEGYLEVKKSPSEIALLLKRSRSTITREINRGRYFERNIYVAEHAHRAALFKNKIKHYEPKLMSNKALFIYVFRGLLKGWSPDQIANRIKLDYPTRDDMRVSYETIYLFIYQRTEGRLQKRLIDLLPYSKPKRSSVSKRHIYLGTIRDRVTISERPAQVNNRSELGHWESDLVIGKGQTSAIGTLVERKTRYTIIVPLESRKTKSVVNAFAKELLRMPMLLQKSITHDNGIEMAAHKLFSKRTKMAVYFAHPYSSWERGTNENTNGLIRRVFKKKTDFNKVSRNQLKQLQNALNDRPRKVLNYKTPNEIVHELCA